MSTLAIAYIALDQYVSQRVASVLFTVACILALSIAVQIVRDQGALPEPDSLGGDDPLPVQKTSVPQEDSQSTLKTSEVTQPAVLLRDAENLAEWTRRLDDLTVNTKRLEDLWANQVRWGRVVKEVDDSEYSEAEMLDANDSSSQTEKWKRRTRQARFAKPARPAEPATWVQ